MAPLPTIIVLLVTLSVASSVRIICYYSSWATTRASPAQVTPEDIDPHLCTHINYAFVSITPQGGLLVQNQKTDVDDGGYVRVVALKQRNPNLKVLLSIGGANAPAELFAQVASDPVRRAAMVGSARWFMETYKFDGVDIDWEIPKIGDKVNFISLLEDFRNDFNKNGWLVTAAVAADLGDGYNVPKMARLLDFINIMTYDLYGPAYSSYTGQNSALYASPIESDWEKKNLNLHSAVNQWIQAGARKDKVVAGIAFYGHTYTLANPANHGLHAPFTGPGNPGPISKSPGSFLYLEYCMNPNVWSCSFDDVQKVPLCLNGAQWFGFDNVESVTLKAKYIRDNGLGGAMVWSLDQDDVHGTCGPARPLLQAINKNIK